MLKKPDKDFILPEAVEGCLWKGKVGITGSITWAQKWVYADSHKLLQWKERGQPGPKSKPKNGFILKNSNLSKSLHPSRKYIFFIIDKFAETKLMLAANSENEYEVWLQFLNKHCGGFQTDEVEIDGLSTSYSNITMDHQTEEDIIADFFFVNSTKSLPDPGNPSISADNLATLLSMIDCNLSDFAAKIVLLEVGESLQSQSSEGVLTSPMSSPVTSPRKLTDGKGSGEPTISYSQFHAWWKEFKDACKSANGGFLDMYYEDFLCRTAFEESNEDPQSENYISRSKKYAKILQSKVNNVEPRMFQVLRNLPMHSSQFGAENVSASTFITTTIPQMDSVIKKWSLSSSGHELVYTATEADPAEGESDAGSVTHRMCRDWNEGYTSLQNAVREETRSYHQQRRDLPTQPSKKDRKKTSFSFAERSSKASVNVAKGQQAELLNSYFDTVEFQHIFNVTAMEGVMTIIKEYTTPESLKTLHRQRPEHNHSGTETELDSVLDDASDGQFWEELVQNGDIFVDNRLVYRIISGSACALFDDDCGADRGLIFNISENVWHKTSSNEKKGSEALCNVLDNMDYRADLRGVVSGVGCGEKSCHTVYSTLIDYCGFRIEVMCPVDINSSHAHSYGLESVATLTNAATVTDFQQLSVQICDALHLSPFVRVISATSSTASVVSTEPPSPVASPSRLAKSLSFMSKKTPVSTPTKVIKPDVFLPLISKEIILRKIPLVVEDGCDAVDRVYAFHLHSIMPADIPRENHQTDVSYRLLRSEYLSQHCPYRCTNSIFCGNDIIAGGSELNGSTFFGDGGTTQGGTSLAGDGDIAFQTAMTLQACTHYYTVHLVHVAEKLDDMFIYDSHSLTQALHEFGVNMRHIGVLYNLCKKVHIRSALIVEAVSRTCKILVFQSLRSLGRKNFSLNTAAPPSKDKQGTREALRSDWDAACTKLLVEMFNLVLGSGSKCNKFWNGILADGALQRFGLKLPVFAADEEKVSAAVDNCRQSCVHLPYLFLSMQYHCGVRFSDSSKYQFGDTGCGNPINLSDFVHVVPVQKICIQYPGLIKRAVNTGEMLLHLGIFDEAKSAFRLQLSTLYVAYRNQDSVASCKVDHLITDITYKLLLCHFGEKQYDVVCKMGKEFLCGKSIYTCSAARIIFLLMCAEFRRESFPLALQYFDSLKAIYSFALGHLHPMHTFICSTLAELYYDYGSLGCAKVMLQNAHHLHSSTSSPFSLSSLPFSMKIAAISLTEYKQLIATHGAEDVETVKVLDQKHSARSISMRQQCIKHYESALLLLDNVMANEAYWHLNAPLQRHVMVCLHSLLYLYNSLGCHDETLLNGFRYLDLLKSVKLNAGSKSYKAKPDEYFNSLDCYIIVGDILVSKLEISTATNVYLEAWNSLKQKCEQLSVAPSFMNRGSNKVDVLSSSTRRALDEITHEHQEKWQNKVAAKHYGAWLSATTDIILKDIWVHSHPSLHIQKQLDKLVTYFMEDHAELCSTAALTHLLEHKMDITFTLQELSRTHGHDSKSLTQTQPLSKMSLLYSSLCIQFIAIQTFCNSDSG